MTWVKICGMTNLEDALVAVEAGADAVGFVFYEKSPRRISVEAAREIVEKLPVGVEKVGVFVDLESEQIREIVLAVGLSAVQLHGRKSMGNVMWEDLRPASECVGASKLIPMVYGDALKDGGFLISDHVRDQIFAILLDSRAGETAGGTGTTFDWAAVRDMVQAVSLTVPVIVAGGLTPANVPEAMRLFQPFGLDVASGVEARPGKKDPEKVRAFVKAVRDADRRAS
ncbi:MAG TPA: phosphoribosylanthranilate isomerase [Candidatus Dormibacteraeota bacterium]|jgi:phosphoribosylanthranilate isomerase|nr:phosphoribosylanthranilate isomerase [Candidatus Dormibacteraeota bacterium]